MLKTTIVNIYDDKTNEHLGSRYYINENEVSFDQYAKFMDDLYIDGRDNSTEVENRNMMDEPIVPCDCDFCCGQRKLERLELEEIKEYEEYACDGNCNERDCSDRPELDCQCEECTEQRKADYLAEAVEVIGELDCPHCVYELLEDIYNKAFSDGFDEGYEEMKLEMQDFLD